LSKTTKHNLIPLKTIGQKHVDLHGGWNLSKTTKHNLIPLKTIGQKHVDLVKQVHTHGFIFKSLGTPSLPNLHT